MKEIVIASLMIGTASFSSEVYSPTVDSDSGKKYIIETQFGKIQGFSKDGVIYFEGVPFAQAPVDELRFKSPRPLEKWDTIYDATYSRAASYQLSSATEEKVWEEMTKIDPGVPGILSAPAYSNKTYGQPIVSEDCLYMNIWIPEKDADKPLPVYVYYHGGANLNSAGSHYEERGANLAKEENIIVIRPNYRMGVLGWVHFGLVDDEFSETVNLGVQDQMASLKWIAENIDSFGGDPQNITIGGESAGGTAVSHLLTNPDSRKYARRAVIQSLTPFNPWCTQQESEARFVAEMCLKLLDIKDTKELMTIDPDRLLAAQYVLLRLFDADANVAWRPLGAFVDGNWVPQQPAVYLSTENFQHNGDFELIMGFAKDEWQFFRGHSETIRHGNDQAVLNVLGQVFGSNAESVLASYRTLYPTHNTPGYLLSGIMSFQFFKFSSLAIADNFVRQGVPVYAYQFSYDLPWNNGELRAVHTGNTAFIFRNYSPEDLTNWPLYDGIDRDAMHYSATTFGALYGEFLRTGKPGTTWKPYDEKEQSILWFGKEIKSVPHLLKGERDIFYNSELRTIQDIEDKLVENVRIEIKSIRRKTN